MTIDFRALQVQTNKLIASGSTGTGARLLIYGIEASSISQPNQGIINTNVFDTGSIGTDAFLFVSGALLTGSNGISVFGGSVRASGSVTVGFGLGQNDFGTTINSHQIFWHSNPSSSGAFIEVLEGGDNVQFAATSQDLTIRAGSTPVSGVGGTVSIKAGDGGHNDGANLVFNDGGDVVLRGGNGGFGTVNGSAGEGGGIYLYGGEAGGEDNFTSKDGGKIYLEAGPGSLTSNGGRGGNIEMRLGSAGAISTYGGTMLIHGAPPYDVDWLFNSGSRIDINEIRKFIVNGTSDPNNPTAVARDIFFFVSGTITASNSQRPSVSVFGGDLVVSGSLMSRRTKTFVPLGAYVTTSATSSNPQIGGQVFLSLTEVPPRSVKLRTILSTTDPTVTSSIQLRNITASAFVEIGGIGITTLSTTSTAPISLESVELLGANNFSTGSAIYEVRIYVATGSANAVHGSSMFVCSA